MAGSRRRGRARAGALVVAALASGLFRRALPGLFLFFIQIGTLAYDPVGNCGNALVPLPNSDLISWWASGGGAVIQILKDAQPGV